MQEENEQFKDDAEKAGDSMDPYVEDLSREANEEYNRDVAPEEDAEEDFVNSLPNNEDELFSLRDKMVGEMEAKYASGDKEMGRMIQGKIHIVNRKLNAMGAEERE